MNQKEKAKQLVDKFINEQPVFDEEDDTDFENNKRSLYFAKKCAIICIEEILQIVFENNFETEYYWHKTDYWNSVRTEINKL